MTKNAVLSEARARLEDVATKLLRRLDPLDTAGTFLGIGVTILATAIGGEKAAAYLRDLADAVEADEKDGGGRAGHA